jgi:hypothetical protein
MAHAPHTTHSGAAPSARAWSTLGLPFGVSLVIHAALLLGIVVAALRLGAVSRDEPLPHEPALAEMIAFPAPARPWPTPAPAPTAAAPTDIADPSPADLPVTARRLQPPDALLAGPALPALPTDPAATAVPTLSGATLPGGPAGSVSGALSAGAPDISFAGLTASGGSRVRSVAYVVDASGPMVSTLPEVLAELRRSVDALAPTQRFNVILFRALDTEVGAGPDARLGPESLRLLFKDRLVDANPRHRAQLADWLTGVTPAGRSNPLDGLRAALALRPRPQVIFLLSRSISRSSGGAWDLGLTRTMQELEALNPVDPATGRRPTVIKTIQFLDADPTGIMLQIAAVHGSGQIGADHVVLRREDLLPDQRRRRDRP